MPLGDDVVSSEDDVVLRGSSFSSGLPEETLFTGGYDLQGRALNEAGAMALWCWLAWASPERRLE
jgi:hypothetical protein